MPKANVVNSKIILKGGVIGALLLLMLIPLYFVFGTVKGRQEYQKEALKKIYNAWGGSLYIAAPVLNVTNSINVYYGGNIVDTKYNTEKISPDDLDVKVEMLPEVRYIGIFQAPVYTAKIKMKGSFAFDGKAESSYITLEINDLKGMAGVPVLIWNGERTEFQPVDEKREVLNLNFSKIVERNKMLSSRSFYERNEKEKLKSLAAKVKLNPQNADTFEIEFDIRGSNNISFVPIGKNSRFEIFSSWANPNFSGNFLPNKRDITKDGFNAVWDINYISSGVPRLMTGVDLSDSLFTTTLVLSVDNYRNAERAVKYGILFIALTFMACFVMEIKSGKQIHPFQYALVGGAMTLFYVLLISVSEFLPFIWAYLIATAACISMIVMYVRFAIIRQRAPMACLYIFLGLACLYSYLYILLQLEDMAMLAGAVGLFISLALVMFTTKDMIWYQDEERK
ncbi:inner membrane protein [Parelusimicrobium proximum]